ncbi:MAG: hypothetical protein EPN69_07745 [Rhodanobacter sp.]|nr:MAG: hypothetical protein EPN69_07745 [Rhodanobacter sp.]TAL99447.1 MAG: hypothetical protein EPN71_07600 [Rhodanobacter sp.]TAM41296.1 MAG: hypothetical protein EPN58_07190 [Rhodanobacter sp.]TAN28559.1 MAG: hypothetical protein EPN32_02550 [Rhodanobacter sp.]
MTSETSQTKVPVIVDRVHHIAFVVADLDRTVDRFEALLGLKVAERGLVASRGAEVAIFKLANINLEVAAPATADSELHRYLNEHGEGFYHIGFGVEDVEHTYSQLVDNGIRMVSRPYSAYKDWRISYFSEPLLGKVRMHIIDRTAE